MANGLKVGFSVLSGIISASLVGATGVFAQTPQAAPPPQTCQPPGAGEYLLMVIHQSPDTSSRLQETLPRNASATVCNYLGRTVTRVGGFTRAETANAWAQYLSEIGGLQTFVTRPVAGEVPQPSAPTATVPSGPQGGTATLPTVPSVPAQPSPPPSGPTLPTAPRPTFAPQPLGTGYVVLVDYFNRPEVAADLQQALTTRVGVAVYQQRPYLMAAYTADLGVAANVLRTLSDRNFSAMILDSRKVVLLSPSVAGL